LDEYPGETAFREKTDILVVVNSSSRRDPSKMLEIFHPALVIVHPLCRQYAAEKWKTACREAGIPFHIISESGAYIENL